MVSRWSPFKEHRGASCVVRRSLDDFGTADTAASADLGAGAETANQWKLSFTPYGWLPWLRGEQTVKGRTVELDVDPIQVMDHLERVPFMGYAEAHNGALILYTDIFVSQWR